MNKSRKILIIKTGFSEFLDRGISTTVSLGDVLICTSILHLYKKDNVTWVTSHNAHRLLAHNSYINKLLIFGPDTFRQISGRTYDIVINLEKDIGLCAFVSQVKARKRYGFYFSPRKKDIDTYKRSTQFLLSGQENQKEINKSGYEILYESVGSRWRGETAILNRPVKRKAKYDIGFNYAVGSKWPTKAWPKRHWKSLEKILKKNYSVSWQQGHKNIGKYIDWIESCRLIVTSDSLAQVLAQALGRKVISLYGPTDHRRMEGIKDITVIRSNLKCPHMPCFLPMCKYHKFCMDYIAPPKVAAACERLLK